MKTYLGLLLIAFFMAGQVSGNKTEDEKKSETSVSIIGDRWYFNNQIINPGSPSEGLLMNVRMVNSVFEDRGPELRKLTGDFNPAENTDSFIKRIPEYVSSGVNAFTISLQGGLPGYEGAVNTAFNSDGSLRHEYLQRVEKVIRACNKNNAVIILSLFYQRQHSHFSSLTGKESIIEAVRNSVNWITERQFSNVILEISNEYRHGGFLNWPDGEWLVSEEGQLELIRLAKQINPELLVSTSGMGEGVYNELLANEVDFILIHFNTTPLNLYESRIETLKKYDKPIVCNEDDKLGPEGVFAQTLAVSNGSGWGYMGMIWNQYFPFEYKGIEDDAKIYQVFSKLTTPGFQPDTESLKENSITISYPRNGELFRMGQTITINLSHLNFSKSGTHGIDILVNNSKIAEINNGLRLRAGWDPVVAGNYNLVAIVKDGGGNVLYSSPGVEIIIQPK